MTIRGNVWYDQYTETGGDAVSFLEYFYGKSEEDAVNALLENRYLPAAPKKPPSVKKKENQPVPFELPAASQNMRRAFAYLVHTRGISPQVIADFAHHHDIFESEPRHNVVFVGRDKNGKPRHAHMRGTLTDSDFRQTVPGSEKQYSFHYLGTGGKLFVFEAPIDMLSYITLHPDNWQEHSYVALCGVSAEPIQYLLNQYPQFEEVCLCLDNDEAGRKATERIKLQLLKEWEVPVSCEIPNNKDWNDDLLAQHQAELQSPRIV